MILAIVYFSCNSYLGIYNHLFWDFCAIITYKYGIYELPHKLPNDLGLKEIRKYQDSV